MTWDGPSVVRLLTELAVVVVAPTGERASTKKHAGVIRSHGNLNGTGQPRHCERSASVVKASGATAQVGVTAAPAEDLGGLGHDAGVVASHRQGQDTRYIFDARGLLRVFITFRREGPSPAGHAAIVEQGARPAAAGRHHLGHQPGNHLGSRQSLAGFGTLAIPASDLALAENGAELVAADGDM